MHRVIEEENVGGKQNGGKRKAQGNQKGVGALLGADETWSHTECAQLIDKVWLLREAKERNSWFK